MLEHALTGFDLDLMLMARACSFFSRTMAPPPEGDTCFVQKKQDGTVDRKFVIAEVHKGADFSTRRPGGKGCTMTKP